MKKRTYAILLSAAAVAALTTACSGKSSSPYKEYSQYVTLGDYKGLTVDRVVYTVTEEDVQNEIDNLLYSYSDTEEVTDRGVEEGDIVNIDYEGTIDGEEFDGGTEEDYELEVGTDSFVEGFDEQLVGMKTGETRDITVTFPEPYDGELDGKEAVFTVTVNQISALILPEYNDDFVKENTSYSSVADYESSLPEELQAANDQDSLSSACYDALSQIIENSTVGGYPDELFEETKKEVEAAYDETAQIFGYDSAADLFEDGYDLDEVTTEALTEKLVIYAIADKENLTVSDEEYDTYVDENVELYGYETKEEFEEDYGADSIKYDILYEKVLDFLGENTNFNDVTEEEYFGADEEDELTDEEGEEEVLELGADEVEALENSASASGSPDEDETSMESVDEEQEQS